MLTQLFSSQARVNLLKHFFSHPSESFYLRQLEKILEESLTPLRRELIHLEKIGLLITYQEGNIKYYRLNKKCSFYNELAALFSNQIKDKVVSETVSEKKYHEVIKQKKKLPLPLVAGGTMFLIMLLLTGVNIIILKNIKTTTTEVNKQFEKASMFVSDIRSSAVLIDQVRATLADKSLSSMSEAKIKPAALKRKKTLLPGGFNPLTGKWVITTNGDKKDNNNRGTDL